MDLPALLPHFFRFTMSDRTIIIALTDTQYVDNLLMIPSVFSFCHSGKPYRVVVHDDPVFTVPNVNIQDPISKNFDLWLDFVLNTDTSAMRCLGEDYKSFLRRPKSDQYLEITAFNLDQFNKKETTTHTFTTPITFNRYGKTKNSRFTYIDGRELVVVKRKNGARGIGQAIVPATQLSHFLQDISLPIAKLAAKYPSATITSSDCELLFGDEFANDLLIQTYVRDIKAEYRLMWNGHRMIAYKRQLNSVNGFNQPEAVVEDAVVHEDVLIPNFQQDGTEDIPPEKVQKLIEFAKFVNLGIGSIDVYVCENGEIGIFEYQQQFGINDIDRNVLQRFHEEFITRLIADWIDQKEKRHES